MKRALPLVWVMTVLALAASLGVAWLPPAPEAPPRAPEVVQNAEPEAPAWPASYTLELEGVAEASPGSLRTSVVDLRPVLGRDQRVEVVYDVTSITRPTTFEALRSAPEWEVGVRLLLGEMGAWRLRDNRWSLLEGVGILETVANRFEPDLSNPLRIEGVRAWPGCGQGGTFASCVDPAQYLGLNSDRALRPLAVTDDALLLHALDRAVAAWVVFEEAWLGEITAGATSFVHLCGGAAYGGSTAGCVGPGARPAHGPVVFRGPSVWLERKGRYALEVLGAVDFEEGPPPEAERAYPDYLLQLDASRYVAEAARADR